MHLRCACANALSALGSRTPPPRTRLALLPGTPAIWVAHGSSSGSGEKQPPVGRAAAGHGALAYLKPVSDEMSDLDIFLSVFYTVVPPSLNPLIYSLRNKDLKLTLRKVFGIVVFKSN
ncbi:putative olfactory receptor 14L1 [Manis javanica]|nr:putative olfactory receptor 14L1 [Manis javanica]